MTATSQLLYVQSLCLLCAGGALLLAARIEALTSRRRLAVAALLFFAVTAYLFPLSALLVHMGDIEVYLSSFTSYAGVREIRFEAHLSHAILGRIYRLLGATAGAPARAFDLLAWGATAWFLICAVAIGYLEQWSALVVRYLGLALIAPSALMYFGYHEIGYLSLNVAVYPLIARGVRDGSPRLEAGGTLAGLGAALHGFGLLSLVGGLLAALAGGPPGVERIRRLLRLAAWGTALYVGWIAVYLIVLKLPVTLGHADAIPWRPWFVDQIVGDRVNAAIFSAVGARDLLVTFWVIGAPLVAVAASLWRAQREEVILALCYAVPSLLFAILFWPIQGLEVEVDLVVAAFPALYALAWVCAHDRRRTLLAALLLASAHVAFWWIVLDDRFMN
jgi:hypothetical protein